MVIVFFEAISYKQYPEKVATEVRQPIRNKKQRTKKKGRKKSADIDLLTHIKEMPQHLTYEQNTSTVMLDSQKGIFSSANRFHKIRFIPDSKIGAKFFHHKRKLF